MGHWSDPQAATGCTVILVPGGAACAVDVRGAAPGTRETDVLRPGNLVDRVHAVVLTGGSAFGLDAASGVMAYLERKGSGFETAAGRVPIVVAAVLYDLDVARADRRPGRAEGEAACEDAERAGDASERQGNVGAGTGATVGKSWGPAYRMKGGLGVAAGTLPSGHRMAALAAVNCVGDVVEPDSGRWVAGAWDRSARRAMGPSPALGGVLEGAGGSSETPSAIPLGPGQATTLVAVVTSLPLATVDLGRVAAMAHDGLARAIRPAHTLFDGDTVFALSTAADQGLSHGGGPRAMMVSAAGALAADLAGRAIVEGVRRAERLGGVPAASEAM